MVSEKFEGKPLLARHRMVNALFAEEMKGQVHGEETAANNRKVGSKKENHRRIHQPPSVRTPSLRIALVVGFFPSSLGEREKCFYHGSQHVRPYP